MKNKSITYLLLAVVVAIWGGIFFKVFSSLASPNQPVTRAAKVGPIEIIAENKPSVFTIRADYRDPFLGHRAVDHSTEDKPVVVKVAKKKAEPKVAPDMSFVKYFGLIRNSGSQKKIGLISIHNQEFMIGDGEEVSGVKCLKHYKDSIIISFQGRRACIKK